MELDQQLAEALRAVRRENTHRMNRMRVVGTGAFVAVGAAIALVPELADASTRHRWQIIFVWILAYFILAVILLLASRLYHWCRRLSRFAVPVFDIPMVVAIQSAHILAGDAKPGEVAMFTLSILVCLVLLSAFALDLTKLAITLAIAFGCYLLLGHLAGLGIGSHLSSVVVFSLVAWICIFAGRNRVDLVTHVTRANARRLRLERYFSPGVAELLEQHDEEKLGQAQECELTVIFADIRGFTRMTEHLEGPEVIAFLNLLHSRMVAAVFEHGGTLDKYLGDGVMIYFNAPVAQPDHALRAVRCALAMQREIAALNIDRWWHGEDGLRLGIGIHSGQAVLGDIGAPHRREFTAIGDTVNVAARLQEMTKEAGNGVLVSAQTVGRVAEDFAWTSVGALPIRGRTEPIEAFSPGHPVRLPGGEITKMDRRAVRAD